MRCITQTNQLMIRYQGCIKCCFTNGKLNILISFVIYYSFNFITSFSSDLEQGYMLADFCQCGLSPCYFTIVLFWGGQSVFRGGIWHPDNPSVSTCVYTFSAGPLNNWICAQLSVYGRFWDDVWNRGFHCHHKNGESRWSVKFMFVLNCIFLSLCEMNWPQQRWGKWCC